MIAMWMSAALAGDPVDQVGRVEIVASRRDDWDVVPLGRDGALLVGHDKDGFTFSRYDTDFKALWSSDWAPDDKLDREGTWVDGGAAWMLMHRGRDKEFIILRLDLATGATRELPFTAPDKESDLDLVVQGDDAWVTGVTHGTWDWIRGAPGILLHADLRAGVVEPMDIAAAIDADKAWLHHLQQSPAGIALTVSVDKKRHRTLYVVPVHGGNLGKPLVVAPGDDDDKNLLTATRIDTPDGPIALGTYANGDKHFGSQGMYLAGFPAGASPWMHYQSFTSFKHFFDYLPEKRRARLAKRIEKKGEEGDDLDLAYNLYLHAPMILGDRLVLVAEAYYPQFHTVTTTRTQTVNGMTQTVTTTSQVFDGWRYTHAVVAAFDRHGELLWDSSVPIGDVLSPTVREQVAVSVVGNHIRMLYCVAGKVYAIEADGNDVHGQKAAQRLEADDEDATVKTSWDSHSVWWYDDWFLLWGYERIKGQDGRKTVFAFTKVGPHV
jgi:hypothetical protein